MKNDKKTNYTIFSLIPWLIAFAIAIFGILAFLSRAEPADGFISTRIITGQRISDTVRSQWADLYCQRAKIEGRKFAIAYCRKRNEDRRVAVFKRGESERAKHASASDLYRLKGNDGGYKNERLKDIQIHARENGLKEWKMLPYLAWLYSENGALSETAGSGDNGHAHGLCQCNDLYRSCEMSYGGQKKQCLNWFKGYTVSSTEHSLPRDVRRGHNSNAGSIYEKKIVKLRGLFEK